MGHNPIPPRRPPDRESFNLGRARDAYVRGDITIERFEELAAHVLAGGYLSQALEPRDTEERASSNLYQVFGETFGIPEPGGLPAPAKPAAPTTRLA